jgi:ABC-type uncharacterized transport system permease subunit
VSTLTWHEVGAYAIAAAIYLAHLVGLRRSAETAGKVMLGVGIALHFADIGVRCYHGVNPISSTPEAMSLVAFLIAAVYLVTSLRYPLTAAGAFAVPAVVALILLARLAPAEASVPTMGRLGQAHILLATLGVAVFAFAAVLAIVYLFQDRSLKRKQLDRVDGARDAAGDAGSAGASLRLDRLPGVHAGDRDRRDLGRAPRAAARAGDAAPEY